jgi:hypothetical protein
MHIGAAQATPPSRGFQGCTVTLRTLHTPDPHLAPFQVQVSHILLSPEQKGLLPQLRQRVAAGESLAALAAEHSQCPSRRWGRGLE